MSFLKKTHAFPLEASGAEKGIFGRDTLAVIVT